MNRLRALSASVRPLLDEDFRSGESPTIDAADHENDLLWERQIDIDPLLAMVDEAMRRFRNDREKSDAWLAPRVHATLRMTRRDAADKRIWYWLNILAKPDYTRWRWRQESEGRVKPVPIDRFMGEDSKNSFGRLWWAAELTRNGASYSDTETALQSQRFSVVWQPLDALHNRACAIAAARFSRSYNHGEGLSNPQSERLSKAFNLKLSTLCLDVLAADSPIDNFAVREWCREPIDETKYIDELPEGPDEAPVSEQSIMAVIAVLSDLAGEIELAEFKRSTRKAGLTRHGKEEKIGDEPENLPIQAAAS